MKEEKIFMKQIKITDEQVDTIIQKVRPKVNVALKKRNKGNDDPVIFNIDQLLGTKIESNQSFQMSSKQLRKIQKTFDMNAGLTTDTSKLHHGPLYYTFHQLRYTQLIFNPAVDYHQELRALRKSAIIMAIAGLIVGLGLIGVFLGTHLVNQAAWLTLYVMHYMNKWPHAVFMRNKLNLITIWMAILFALVIVFVSFVVFFVSLVKIILLNKELSEK